MEEWAISVTKKYQKLFASLFSVPKAQKRTAGKKSNTPKYAAIEIGFPLPWTWHTSHQPTTFHIIFFLFFRRKKSRWNRNGLRAYWESCGRISLKSVARTLSSPSPARSRPCVSCQTQIKREKCAESIVSDKLIRYFWLPLGHHCTLLHFHKFFTWLIVLLSKCSQVAV